MTVKKDETVQKKEAWYYAFEVKDPSTGKRKTIKKRGFLTKKEAEYEEAEAKNAWNKGVYLTPDNTPFSEYITNWLRRKQDISDQTRHTNEGHIKKHIIPLLGQYTLAKINVEVIETFIEQLQQRDLAESTVRKIFNIVNTALNAAVKKQMMLRNPAELLDSKPRVRKTKVEIWTVDEIKKFLNSFDTRYKIVYQMAIYTGMRMGEILGLSLYDIDFENKQIHIRQTLDFNGIPKSGAKTLSGNRSITIPDGLLEDMKAQYEMITDEMKHKGETYNKYNLFICTSNGNPYRKQQLTKAWHILLKEAKVKKIRFHDLRHTCASLLLSIGTHPKVVQELLGHSSIKITLDLYSHLMPNMQSDAVNALGKILD